MKKIGLCKALWARHAKLLVMVRLFTFLILIVAIQPCSNGFAQGVITISEKNAPLQLVGKKIQSQNAYFFTNTNESIKISQIMNVKDSIVPINDTLYLVIADGPASLKEPVANNGAFKLIMTRIGIIIIFLFLLSLAVISIYIVLNAPKFPDKVVVLAGLILKSYLGAIALSVVGLRFL